jgi:O-antigen/teichoic acid export membrane protein
MGRNERRAADFAVLRESKDVDAQRSLLAHFSYYSLGRYLSEFCLLLRGFLLAGVLGPALFGVWTKIKIALLLLHYGQLGVHEAMLREVPFAAGKKQDHEAKTIERNVLGFDLFVAVAVSVLLVAIVFLVDGSAGAALHSPWLLLAAIFGASQLYWYVHAKLRAEKRFASVSRTMIGFAAASTLLGLAAAHHHGLAGFLIALGLSHVLAVLLANPGGTPLPRPALDDAVLRRLIRIGFPIMASGGLATLLWNVDKIAIWCLLPRESLGVYALASYLVISVTMFPESVAAVLYPRLMERLAKTGTGETIARYLVRPTLLIGNLCCPLLGVLFLALHVPLRWWLPKYAAGLVPGQILIAFLFFMAITRIPLVVLVSLNRQKLLLTLTGIAVFGASTGVVALLLAGQDLIGAAAGMAGGYVLYGVLLLSATLRVVRLPRAALWSFLGELVLPYVVTAVIVAAAAFLSPATPTSFVADLAQTAGQCSCVAAVGVGLLWRAHRRYGLLVRPAGGA